MRRLVVVLVLLLAAPLARTASAQGVFIDRGVRAAGLWCFPLVVNEREYVYLPADARLALDDAGDPNFSFIRYVLNEPGTAGEATITSAAGGGVLHFLVLYETPPEQAARAAEELKRITGDDEVTLRGPIVFTDGRYTLVSAILSSDGSKKERAVLATGRAPVLEGNRLAFSFDLEPAKASLLLESFQMATPDVSIVFDMTFTGLSEAYDAELLIDWSEVRQSHGFEAGGSAYFVSADVELMFDDLRRNHAIQLRSSGSDASMEALLDTVYSKLLELMFRRVEPERVPADQRGGLMDALAALVDTRSGPLSSPNTTGFGAYVGYQLKDLRSSGESVLNFNHRATVERHSFITFNIGDLHRRYGADERFFRAVNLGDPTYQQREVHVAVDGSLAPEFERFINSVTVTLRKTHENGEETLRELVLDRADLTEDAGAGDRRMVYGWNGDADRLRWLTYDYRTRWSFEGGGTHETDWVTTEAPMIDLYAPYERRHVQLVGEPNTLGARGVRAVVVELEYPFFGESRREQVVLRPGVETERESDIELTLPLGHFDYRFSVTWMLEGGRRLTASGTDSAGVVFIDELPEG